MPDGLKKRRRRYELDFFFMQGSMQGKTASPSVRQTALLYNGEGEGEWGGSAMGFINILRGKSSWHEEYLSVGSVFPERFLGDCLGFRALCSGGFTATWLGRNKISGGQVVL